MLQRWLFREPALSFGWPLYVCAAVLFPLHLGWIGASPMALVGYIALAAALFSLVDATWESDFYGRWQTILLQTLLSMLALSLPALLAFAIGSALGPVEEALDERVCAGQRAGESDSLDTESNDTFDVTADCIDEP